METVLCYNMIIFWMSLWLCLLENGQGYIILSVNSRSNTPLVCILDEEVSASISCEIRPNASTPVSWEKNNASLSTCDNTDDNCLPAVNGRYTFMSNFTQSQYYLNFPLVALGSDEGVYLCEEGGMDKSITLSVCKIPTTVMFTESGSGTVTLTSTSNCVYPETDVTIAWFYVLVSHPNTEKELGLTPTNGSTMTGCQNGAKKVTSTIRHKDATENMIEVNFRVKVSHPASKEQLVETFKIKSYFIGNDNTKQSGNNGAVTGAAVGGGTVGLFVTLGIVVFLLLRKDNMKNNVWIIPRDDKGEYVLIWKWPTDVRRYLIYKSRNGENWKMQDNVQSYQTSYNVHGFEFQWKICAEKEKGQEVCVGVATINDGVPGKPEDVSVELIQNNGVGGKKANLWMTWKTPDDVEKIPIQNYQIYLNKHLSVDENDDWKLFSCDVPADRTYFTYADWEEGTDFQIGICAVNKQGHGQMGFTTDVWIIPRDDEGDYILIWKCPTLMSDVGSYLIYKRRNGVNWTISNTFPLEQTSYNFRGTEFEWKVCAKKENGKDAYIGVATVNDSVLRKPEIELVKLEQDLRDAGKRAKLQMTWKTPDLSEKHPIQYYQIYLNKSLSVRENDNWKLFSDVPADSIDFTHVDWKEGTDFQIGICAVNKQGHGQMDFTKVSAPSTPASLAVLRIEKKYLLSWNLPKSQDCSDIVELHILKRPKSENTSWKMEHIVKMNNYHSTKTIDDAAADYRCYALNQHVSGQPLDTVRKIAERNAPDKPQDARLNIKGNAYSIEWRYPQKPPEKFYIAISVIDISQLEKMVKEYYFENQKKDTYCTSNVAEYIKKNTEDQLVMEIFVTASETTYETANLRPDKHYIYSICAVNQYGCGTPEYFLSQDTTRCIKECKELQETQQALTSSSSDIGET